MMKQTIHLIIFGLLLSSPAVAGTYKWVDEEGNVVYSQHPPAKGKYESIRVKPASRKPSEDNSVSKNEKFLKETDKTRKNDKKIKAELQNSEKIRKENCQNAKKQFEFYTVYRRMKGKDGESRRILDDEREKKLQEARQAIKDFCD